MKMKMKLLTIALSVSLTVSSLSSMANNVVFKPTNNNLATQACYLAATQGMSAVKALVKNEHINFGLFKSVVSCNDLSLTKFANKYQPQIVEETKLVLAPTVALIAKNSSVESKVCLDALVIGEQRSRRMHNLEKYNITCNNQDIKTFVRKYKKQNVVVRNSAE